MSHQNAINKLLAKNSAAKPDPFFFEFNPILGQFLGSNGTGWPQDPKTAPIGSGWPQIEFKFGINPIMYNRPDLNGWTQVPTRPVFGGSGLQCSKSGWVGSVGPRGQNSSQIRVGWIHLAALAKKSVKLMETVGQGHVDISSKIFQIQAKSLHTYLYISHAVRSL